MLWPATHLSEVYEKIHADSLKGGCTVLIFVALDCDALCSCKVLTNLFKSDNIAYKIKPVSGYDDVQRGYENLVAQNREIKSIIMINCGGGIDLQSAYPLEDDMHMYVIDSHRPYYHHNILRTSTQVVVLGDDFLNLHESDIPGEHDEELLESDDEIDSDEESDEDGTGNSKRRLHASDDEEEEFLIDGENSNSSHKRIKGSDEDAQSSHSEGVNENSNREGNGPSVRTSKAQKRITKQQDKILRRQRWKSYYHGTYTGQPAVHTAYNLALQLNKECVPLLWLAIVGTSYHYLMDMLPNDKYDHLLGMYREQAKDMSSDPNSGGVEEEDGILVPSSEGSKIEFLEEYRLMLYRHWSLYDAFYYSNYVASRLGTWRMDGKNTLNTFFAKLGISLKECRQKYSFMSSHLKQRLRDKIATHGTEFRLDDFTYGSFQFETGFKTQLNAADVVYSVTALLEADEGFSTTAPVHFSAKAAKTATERDEASSPSKDPNSDDGALEARLKREAKQRELWEENFNIAMDSLLSRRAFQLTQRGLDLSMELQRAVVFEGITIMEEKLIRPGGRFRYVVLDRLTERTEAIFRKPHGLHKLALFLVQAYRDSGQWVGSAAIPLVVGVVDANKTSAMLLGLQCNENGEVKRNQFEQYFHQAAKYIEVTYEHEGFGRSLIEIKAEEVRIFLHALYQMMSE